MFVKCSRPDAGMVQTYSIYISMLSWICLIRQFVAVTLPSCPFNPRDTSTGHKARKTWKGPNSVWRLFGWSPKKLPVVEANFAIEEAFWPGTQLNHSGWRPSASITLELPSTCTSPGRMYVNKKGKFFTTVTGRGQDQRHHTLGFDENPAPRQHFSWKSPGKKPSPNSSTF